MVEEEQQKRGKERDGNLYEEGRASFGLTKTTPLLRLLIIGIETGNWIVCLCPNIGSKLLGASFVISKLPI